MSIPTNLKNKTGTPLQLKKFRDVKAKYVGAVGSPERTAYEDQLLTELNELVAEKIKNLRKANNLTQEELGNKLGVKKSQISRLESSTSNVTLGTLQKVCIALDAKIHIDFITQ